MTDMTIYPRKFYVYLPVAVAVDVDINGNITTGHPVLDFDGAPWDVLDGHGFPVANIFDSHSGRSEEWLSPEDDEGILARVARAAEKVLS